MSRSFEPGAKPRGRTEGLKLVKEYPPVSQDFNAIESAWALLKNGLQPTLPRGMEDRDAFIKRLAMAVAWINKKNKKALEKFSRNQKQRARDCLASTPPGSRTKW